MKLTAFLEPINTSGQNEEIEDLEEVSLEYCSEEIVNSLEEYGSVPGGEARFLCVPKRSNY